MGATTPHYFRPGHPGPGRPKGSKDKLPKPDQEHLLRVLKDHGFDTVAEGIKLFRDEKTVAHDKVLIWKEMMSYLFNKQRSVEAKSEHNHTHIAINWDSPSPTTVVQTVADTIDVDAGPDDDPER